MKSFKYILALSVGFFFAIACTENYIDPIKYVAPGADASAPVITVTYPTEGVQIQVPTLVTSIDIKFEADDDIELKSITVSFDGTQLKSYSSSDFTDYRRAIKALTYSNVTNGAHVLTIVATDMSGKSTTKTVNFVKKPPYVPIYPGEVFYMPFDGDYMEKVSFVTAGVVGTPGFVGTGFKGVNAYKGNTDSYLTFPIAGLKSNEISAEFWYKPNGSPDRSGMLVVSPSGASSFDASRTKGFRLFREGSATSQQIKLNVGQGNGEVWNDGGFITLPTDQWVHIAFTISVTTCTVYINGVAVRSAPTGSAIDWTGCTSLSIASGQPNYIDWGHLADNSYYDELRIFNKALTSSEVQTIMQNDKPYVAKYSGEVLYMPFEGNFKELVSKTDATKVGSPTFDDNGKIGKAYKGAADSYISFPTAGIVGSNGFSAVFWYKTSTLDRAGIITISPPSTDGDRTKGFRLMREPTGTNENIWLNVGNGTAEDWWNPVFTVAIPVPTPPADANGWMHIAISYAPTHASFYVNGVLKAEKDYAGPIDWTNCSQISIGSGQPNTAYWDHFSDLSLIDELRIFNKAISATDVQTIYNNEK